MFQVDHFQLLCVGSLPARHHLWRQQHKADEGALPVQDTVALPPQVIRSLWGLLGDGECHGNVTVTYRKLPTGGQPGIPSHSALHAVFVAMHNAAWQYSRLSGTFSSMPQGAR